MTIVVTTTPAGALTYIDAVNRLLRITTVVQYDDDDITSFSQNQHSATIALARQSIQHVINDLISDSYFLTESTKGHITTVAGTRTYDLQSTFVRFRDVRPWLQELAGAIGTDATGPYISEYTGGEAALQRHVPAYTSQQGTPQWYYFTDDQTLGIYPIPSESKIYRFDFQKIVMPESENDSVPFATAQMAYALIDMAARVFTLLFTQQPIDGIYNDSIYKTAKRALIALNVKSQPSHKYGYVYR